jgi:hypothetical protein
VDDARRVRRRQPAAGGDEDVQYVPPRPRLRPQPLVNRASVDQLHRDEDTIDERARVVHGHDVRVRQARDGARLAQQPNAALAAAVPEPMHDLQGDAAIQVGVVGGVDLAHAAAAERAQDLVAADA